MFKIEVITKLDVAHQRQLAFMPKALKMKLQRKNMGYAASFRSNPNIVSRFDSKY